MSEADDPFAQAAPDSLTELAADAAKKKRRTMLTLFVVIPVVVAAGGGAAWYFGEQAADEAVNKAWSEASGCLVGAPLGEGDKASLRARQVQLTAVHSERDKKTEARWPNRCAEQVAGLHEALRKSGRGADGEEGLPARSETLAVNLRKAEVMTDFGKELDGLYAAAATMGLKAAPASLQVPTPEPAKGLTLDAMPASSRLSGHQFTLDSVSATPMVGNEIHIMVHDKKIDPTPIVCTFRPSGDDECRPLGGELVGKSGLRLGATVDDGGSPLVLAGREGDKGVYRTDGTFEKITSMEVQSSWVSKEGYVALTSYNDSDGNFDLVTQAAPGAPVNKMKIDADDVGHADELHRKNLLWGKLLVQGLFEGPGSNPKLFYADLPPVVGKPRFNEIAEVNWVNAQIFGCRTKDSLAVVVGRNAGFLTFLEKSEWSSPVRIDSIGGAFSCHAGEAVFTNPFGGQQRCTPAGCKFVDGLAPEWEPFRSRDVYWADLSGKVLAVASTDRRGGLRYRWADGKNLAVKGSDRILFDDLVNDGEIQTDSTLLGLKLAGRGNFAVLLMTTPKGVYALRFGADGQPKPATIKQ